MEQKYQEYLERRIQKLIQDGWEDSRIIQQLECGFGKKNVIRTLAEQRKVSQ